MILRAVLSALPLEQQPMRLLQSVTEGQTALMWFQPALELGREDTSVLLSKPSILTSPALDEAAVSRHATEAKRVEADESDHGASTNVSTSPQVADKTTHVGVWSVIGMGGGLLVYVAMLVHG